MKILKSGKEARDLIISGANKVADAVKITLGPSGGNALIGGILDVPVITNDGVTIAQNIKLDDEIEQLGAETITAISLQTNQIAGDGTTTTMVLAQAILKEGSQRIESGENSNNIRKQINEVKEQVIKLLKEHTKEVKSMSDLKKIATIAVENEDIGAVIAKMVQKTGKNGVITTEEYHLSGVKEEYIQGLELRSGFVYPQFSTSGDFTVEMKKTYVLMTTHKITSIKQVQKILDELISKNIKQIVILADDFDNEVYLLFLKNRKEKGINIIPIKVPPRNQIETLKDIASVVGGEIIDADTGMELELTTQEHLGMCSRFKGRVDKSLFIGGKGGSVKERVKQLEKELQTAPEHRQEEYQQRIANLLGGIGILKVGGSSDQEKTYLLYKIEDAINATRAAYREGVVEGGGLVLKKISEQLKDNILTNALKAPYNQIQENAGGHLKIEKDVLDPVLVTRTAVEKACSAAAIILTAEVGINNKTIQ